MHCDANRPKTRALRTKRDETSILSAGRGKRAPMKILNIRKCPQSNAIARRE